MCTVLDNFCNTQGTTRIRSVSHMRYVASHSTILDFITLICCDSQTPHYAPFPFLLFSLPPYSQLFIHWQVLSISHHPVFPQQFTPHTQISLLFVPDESVLQFYNQNKKEILNIILPIAQETAEEIITQIGNSILNSVPFSELLPAWATTYDCFK